jgi:hypothetical protein
MHRKHLHRPANADTDFVMEFIVVTPSAMNVSAPEPVAALVCGLVFRAPAAAPASDTPAPGTQAPDTPAPDASGRGDNDHRYTCRTSSFLALGGLTYPCIE